MDKAEVIKILKEHNRWRRRDSDEDDEPLVMGCVKKLGEAIDRAVQLLEAT